MTELELRLLRLAAVNGGQAVHLSGADRQDETLALWSLTQAGYLRQTCPVGALWITPEGLTYLREVGGEPYSLAAIQPLILAADRARRVLVAQRVYGAVNWREVDSALVPLAAALSAFPAVTAPGNALGECLAAFKATLLEEK